MSEPSAATPSEAASGRLVATKLFVPRPQPGLVPRQRLLDRLDEGVERGIVLVCAPAGFGKTALVADWSRRSRRPVAWLSLDAGDDDPARFWRHAVAALDRLRPGLAEHVAPLLGPPAPPAFDGLVSAVADELAAHPDDVVLVVDDVHLVRAERVHAALALLLEHLPPRLQVVLTSREDPPLGVARLRARGRLAELRAPDLRFTADEAAALLSQAVGRDLPASAVATLTGRTEGWAAGLQLAGLSLRGRSDVSEFVARFSGSHRYVLDYLSEEVLAQQPEEVIEFLLATAILRRLSGALCDAVTGRSDSQAVLEALEAANLFLVPLDDVRGWWAYHGLFADVLRAQLQRRWPGRAGQLHRAAGAWFEAHGFADDAVHHALAAGDHAWVARLVERHADALLLHSEGDTVARWLAALPADVLTARPRALLAQARLALLAGRGDVAQEALDSAERALAAGADSEPYEPAVGGGASLVANVPATIALDRAYLAVLDGDAERAGGFALQARAASGDGEWMLRSHADGYLALAELLAGRPDEAERLLTAAIATWRGAGEVHLAVRGCHHLGQVRRAQGRLDAAADAYRDALEIAAPAGRPPLPAAGLGHVGLAEVAYERDDLDTALAHLDAGLELCRQLVYTQPLATGLATLAAIRHLRGDRDGAAEALARAERVPRGAGVTGPLDPVPARRARLRLAQGDVAAAARWVAQRGLDVDDEARFPREAELLVLARVLVAQERPREALALVERLLAVASAQGRLGSVIELGAVRALALAALGAEAEAVAALTETLALACPQGYVRVFADEGAPMATLLGRVVAGQGTRGAPAGDVPFDCLMRLQRAFATVPRPAGGPAPGLVEPLTSREHEVLALLAQGRTNADIAAALFVTIDTVKKHVSRVLDKLGAGNRTEAVARARGLGLLDR